MATKKRNPRAHVRKVSVATGDVKRATYEIVIQSGLGVMRAKVLAAEVNRFLRDRAAAPSTEGHSNG